jgi:hypothetical protein
VERIVVEIIDDPKASAFAAAFSGPTQFANAAGLRNDSAGLGVRPEKRDKLGPLFFVKQCRCFAEEEGRFDHGHGRVHHLHLDYTL